MNKKNHRCIRRILVVAMTVLLVTVLCIVGIAANNTVEPATEVQECYIPWDYNTDGNVTDRDAVYLLYSSIDMFADRYPIHGSGDLNGDDVFTEADAIYLLWATFGATDPEEWEENTRTVHVGYVEQWSWLSDTVGEYNAASLKLTCECGTDTATATDEDLKTSVTTEPTCMTAGQMVYEASVTLQGKSYPATSSAVPVSALGHDMKAASCEEARKCERCGHSEGSALGHQWILDKENSVLATCGADGKEVYKCGNAGCKATQEAVDTNRPLHTYVQQTPVEISTNKACEYQTQTTFICSGCSASYSDVNEPYTRHDYSIVELTKVATCQTAGVKTYTCSVCRDFYNVDTDRDSSAHNWVVDTETAARNTVTEDITYYHCQNDGCTETKVTKVVTSNTAVSTNDLKDTELQLAIGDNSGTEGDGDGESANTNNAALTFDQEILENLDSEITLSVDTVPEDKLPEMSEEQKAQLGNSVVYDFTMKDSNDELITDTFDNGNITITLPYTLEEGEDPDNIVVWYIANDGKVTAIDATYSNGFVTFQTNHFSYYTVTRLTPAERCAKYDHLELVVKHREASCTEDGYHIETCPRCSENVVNEIYAHPGHDYKVENADATCTESGSIVKTCQVTTCGHTISATIPAKGHNMQLDDANSKDASCVENGVKVYICNNGCNLTITEELPATNHDFGLTEEHPATCLNNGHKDYVCKNSGCSATFSEVTQGATGHLYNKENAKWEWTEDESGKPVSAVCVLHCAYHPNEDVHTKTLSKVAVTSKTEGQTCTTGGVTTYTATVTFNQETFTETKTVEVPARGHIAEVEWTKTGATHSRACSVCGVELEREAHTMVDGEVVVAATCITKGEVETSCSVCGYESGRVVAATGIHDYDQYRVCRVCGKSESDCKHYRLKTTEIDLSGYNFCEGTRLRLYSCECGYDREYYLITGECNIEQVSDRVEIAEDGQEFTVHQYRCVNCDLNYESGSYYLLANAEKCESVYMGYISVYAGDELLGSSVAEYEGHSKLHAITEYETIVLTPEEHGICRTIIQMGTCSCGERQDNRVLDTDCDTETYIDGPVDHSDRCINCNAIWHNSDWVVSEERCYTYRTRSLEVTRNDELVFDFIVRHVDEHHSYIMVDSELYGSGCEDGAVAIMECHDCGYVYEELVKNHDHFVWIDIIDTSAYDVCFDELIQKSCVCGEQGGWDMESVREQYCDFILYQISDDGSTYYEECEECGAQLERKETWTALEEDCLFLRAREFTFRDAEGNVIATSWEKVIFLEHDYETVYTLLGESCEEGVIRTEICTVCGDSYSDTYYSHDTHPVNTYDLSDLGMCADEAVVFRCACGLESYVNWYTGENDGCEWECTYPDDDTEIRHCSICDVTIKIYKEALEAIDDCHTRYNVTYSFSRNDAELLAFSHEQVRTNHAYYEVFELVEGAKTCADGYIYKEYCENCDYTWVGDVNYGNCDYTALIDDTVYSDDRMCGGIRVVTYSCACGQNFYQDTFVVGEECSFVDYDYNPETGVETAFCEKCGVKSTVSAHCGMSDQYPCVQVETYEVSYSYNNSELFAFTVSNHNEIHSYYSVIELYGESCADGFDITMICRDCGHVYCDSSYDEGDCSWSYVLNSEVILDGSTTCTKVVKETIGCPCGKNTSSQMNTGVHIRSEYVETDEEGWQVILCHECGLIERQKEVCSYTEDSCEYHVLAQYEYWQNDQKIGETSTYDTRYDHQMVCEFVDFTGNCDDGYTVIGTCICCGETEEWNSFGCGGHATERTLIYLSETCGWTQLYSCSCPCGNIESEEWLSSCAQNHVGSDGEWDIYECPNCDLIRKTRSTTNGKVDSCEIVTRYEHVLEVNGEQIDTITYEQVTSYDHAFYVTGVNKLGDDCMDGYTVFGECYFCGEPGPEETFFGCYDLRVMIELLCDAEGTCGNHYATYYGCPCCGKMYGSAWDHYCNLTTVSLGMVDGVTTYIHRCSECGMEVTESSYRSSVEGSCDILITVNLTYSINGEIVDTATAYAYDRNNHKYVYDLHTDGIDCSYGYTATGTCYYCGDTTSETGYGCGTYLVNYQEVYVEGMCGPYILEITNCACGIHQNIVETGPCLETYEKVHTEEGENSVVEYYCCTECGLEAVVSAYSGLLSERCFVGLHFDFTWIWDGQIIEEYSYEIPFGWDHRVVYTFEMLGEGLFIDGCNVYGHCELCGVNVGLQETIYEYKSYPVEFVLVTDDMSICGGRRGYYLKEFPDGTPDVPEWSYECSNVTTTYDEQTGMTVTTCNSCGLVVESATEDVWEQGTHDYYLTWNYTLRKNDQILGTVNETFNYVIHVEAFAFDLLGEDCEDGYRIYATCAFCDIRHLIGWDVGHIVLPVGIVDLEVQGLCGEGSYFIQFSCACKTYAYIEADNQCVLGDLVVNEMVEDGNTIVHTVAAPCTNPDCASVMQTQKVTIIQPEGACKSYMRMTYTFTLADGTEIVAYHNDVGINHLGEQVTTYELMDGVSCAGGVQATTVCTSCQEVVSSEYYTYCKTHQVGQIDMSEMGATCGGYIAKSECACGTVSLYEVVDQSCSLEETVIDLFVDNVVAEGYYETMEGQIYVSNAAAILSCTVDGCDYRVRIANYWVKEGCKLVNYEVAQYGYDPATGRYELELVSTLNVKEYHPVDSLYTYRELMEGSDYCYNGAWLITNCTDCGREISRSSYFYCETFPQDGEKIDLTEYGSLCGGYLAKMDCLCGEANPETIYSFHELKCDLDKDEIAHFVDGTLDDEARLYEGNYYWVDSESYLYTCAVTHPEVCGMKIRYSRCWLQEGCYAVEYEVWQLDYDPATDTWADEIREATGNTMIFHPYETTSVQTDSTYSTNYNCPLCGTYGREKYFYSKDAVSGHEWRSAYEWLFVSNLDDDNCVRVRSYEEYVLVGDRDLISLDRFEESNNTGYDYWYQYEYEYDFTEGCYEKETYTNSDGAHRVEEYRNQHRRWHGYWTVDLEPTCAQFGRGHHDWRCALCDQTVQIEDRNLEPTDHTWEWNRVKQLYECRDCGLECINDASGSIVLEDLTEELGNGTNYVVAYWNRGNIDYSLYVNVVMNDRQGDNEEWLDVEVTDKPHGEYGTNLIYFNIAEAEAAAQTIMGMAGYTGDYAIRLTFAPKSVTDELDYSITFDTLAETDCNHLWVRECDYATFTGNCDDGYYYSEYCALCGKNNGYFPTSGCWDTNETVELLYYSETCGWSYVMHENCPCGSYTDSCIVVCGQLFHGSSMDEAFEWSCENCGLVLQVDAVAEYAKDSCLVNWYCDIVLRMKGEVVASQNVNLYSYNHLMIGEFSDFTGNCDDGYRVIEYCALCGKNNGYSTRSGCWGISTKVTPIYHSETCGWVYVKYSECPCGSYTYSHIAFCNGYLYSGNVNEASCENCGLVLQVDAVAEDAKDSCLVNRYCDIELRLNGEVVASLEENLYRFEHLMSSEFTDFPEYCDDGYTVIERCVVCGMSRTATRFGCQAVITDVTLIYWSESCGWTYKCCVACPCGSEDVELLHAGCSWEDQGAEDGWGIYKCTRCGTIEKRHIIEEGRSDFCHFITRYDYVFEQSGAVVATASVQDIDSTHVYTCEFEDVKTCDERYKVISTCVVCNEIRRSYESGCKTYPVAAIVINRPEICGIVRWVYRECPQGHNKTTFVSRKCNFSYVGRDGIWSIYSCSDCGLIEKSCDYYKTGEYTCEKIYVREQVYELNGEIVGSAVYEEIGYYDHMNYVTEVNRLGEDCADGYTVSGECYYCGEDYLDSTVYKGCWVFPLQVQTLCDEEAICGDFQVAYFGCPCCEIIKYIEFPSSCSWVTDSEGTENGVSTYVGHCEICGLEMTLVESRSRIEDSCATLQTVDLTFKMDDQVVDTATVQYVEGGDHLYVYEFSLMGETCDEGYTATGTCYYCGDVRVEDGKGCARYLVDYCVTDQPGSCGTNIGEIYNCACGMSIDFYEDWSCNMEVVDEAYDEYGGGTRYSRCTECGMEMHEVGTYGLINNSCGMGGKIHADWIWEDAVIADLDFTEVIGIDHKIVYTFNMLGDSLFADGYELYAHCDLCSLDLGYQGVFYGYEVYPVEYVNINDNLALNQFCGDSGRLGYYMMQAPNGDLVDMRLSTGCQNHSILTSELPGYTYWVCQNCGLEQEYLATSQWTEDGCNVERTLDCYLRMNGQELGRITETFTVTQHTEAYEFELLGEDCNDGYTVYAACSLCDFSMQIPGTFYGHQESVIAGYPLYGMGVCTDANGNAGAVHTGCACGEISNYEWNFGCELVLDPETETMTQIDENTVEYSGVFYCANPECTTAKFTIRESVTLIPGTSEQIRHLTIIVTMDNGLEFELQREAIECNHQGVETYARYELLAGSTTCADGAYESIICSNCGAQVDGHSYYECEVHEVETIDMTSVGSSCGGQLKKYACVCSAIKTLEIVDTGCNLIETECDMFVTDAVADGVYATTTGDLQVASQYAAFICENEGCGFSIRTADYWTMENGNLVHYEIVQYGYDPVTGKCKIHADTKIEERVCISNEMQLSSLTPADERKNGAL